MTADRALVTSFLRRRDEAAFRALYRGHTPFLHAMATRLTGGPADVVEDLVEDTWVRAAERLPTFAWKSSLRTWLAGILINCHREARRRSNSDVESAVDDHPAHPPPLPVEERIDLESALAQLSNGYREIIVLHDVYGYTHREIGSFLGIDEGTSKSQLARGRRRLRDLLT